MIDTMLLKITAADGSPLHGGTGRWPLPTDDGPGEWRTVEGELEPCWNGLHLVEPARLSSWLRLDAVVWQAEVDGEVIRDVDKVVARRARLVRRLGVLDRRLLVAFAAGCAERVLPLFEAARPDDGRPRAAIAAARGWLAGTMSARDAADAARAADDDRAAAASYTVSHAAYAAAYAADAAYAAAYAVARAADAARAAAYAVAARASDAARARAAYAAQRKRQADLLLELLAEQERRGIK